MSAIVTVSLHICHVAASGDCSKSTSSHNQPNLYQSGIFTVLGNPQSLVTGHRLLLLNQSVYHIVCGIPLCWDVLQELSLRMVCEALLYLSQAFLCQDRVREISHNRVALGQQMGQKLEAPFLRFQWLVDTELDCVSKATYVCNISCVKSL